MLANDVLIGYVDGCTSPSFHKMILNIWLLARGISDGYIWLLPLILFGATNKVPKYFEFKNVPLTTITWLYWCMEPRNTCTKTHRKFYINAMTEN